MFIVVIVRDDGRASRYSAMTPTRPYKTAKRMDGAKSRSKGIPPIGAGNVNVASGADILRLRDEHPYKRVRVCRCRSRRDQQRDREPEVKR